MRRFDEFQTTTRTAHNQSAQPTGARSGDFRCTCPNCGSELWDKECKSRCPKCHFFTDCSDPW